MNRTSILIGFVGALLFAPRLASADQCPVADIGQPCAPTDGTGTCISATCTNTSSDGSTTTKACGYCVDLPDNACSPDGGTCEGGAVCTVSGGGAGGGVGVGGGSAGDGGAATPGPSMMVSYGLGTCEVPEDGGDCVDCLDAALTVNEGDAAAKTISEDASARGGARDRDAGSDAGHETAGGQPEAPPSQPASSGGGCTTSSETGASGRGGSLLMAGVILSLRRRRGTPRRART